MNEIKRNQTVLVRKNFPFPVVDACTMCFWIYKNVIYNLMNDPFIFTIKSVLNRIYILKFLDGLSDF